MHNKPMTAAISAMPSGKPGSLLEAVTAKMMASQDPSSAVPIKRKKKKKKPITPGGDGEAVENHESTASPTLGDGLPVKARKKKQSQPEQQQEEKLDEQPINPTVIKAKKKKKIPKQEANSTQAASTATPPSLPSGGIHPQTTLYEESVNFLQALEMTNQTRKQQKPKAKKTALQPKKKKPKAKKVNSDESGEAISESIGTAAEYTAIATSTATAAVADFMDMSALILGHTRKPKTKKLTRKRSQKQQLQIRRHKQILDQKFKEQQDKLKSTSQLYLEDPEEFVQDDDLVQVGWLSVGAKESIEQKDEDHNDDKGDNDDENATPKPKPKKQLRSSVEYSYPHYVFTTRDQLAAPSYYLQRVEIEVQKKRKKKTRNTKATTRHFNISNLFRNSGDATTERTLFFGKRPYPQQQQQQDGWKDPSSSSRVYHFDDDACLDAFQSILDRKEDKWWIKSRLPQYVQRNHDDNNNVKHKNKNSPSKTKLLQRLHHQGADLEDIDFDMAHTSISTHSNNNMNNGKEEEDQQQGYEILSIFFGENEIDHCNDSSDDDDDDSLDFSIASVHSVTFSDDDNDFQESFRGKPRDRVEVMPGEFKISRSEEETYDAIERNQYMSSLCLGCGIALVSVQDALQVACPNCGSITPLNGISLHKPFGIATGVRRAKCEHLLTPRKSVFLARTQEDLVDDQQQERESPGRRRRSQQRNR